MKIVLSPNARKALVRSHKRIVILEKLHLLAHELDALRNNIKAMRGSDEFRLRVQDWRVIYRLADNAIQVREIAPRSSVYEDRS